MSLHDWVFSSQIDPTTYRRWLPFSSTLVLSGLNVYEGLAIDDPKKAEWREFVFRARGRDLKGAVLDLASLPKVDFEGAQLQGASLQYSQLQGASLVFAQLQGASLLHTSLEGAALDFAQLQGASLDFAQLQGASLDGARLQGASLQGAQLQGASLQRAELKATNLSGALLWRSNSRESFPGLVLTAIAPKAIKLLDLPNNWLPSWMEHAIGAAQPRNDKGYQTLRQMIETLPPGIQRNQALDRIRTLDCGNSDPTLASCDPSAPPPPEAVAWRKSLEDAAVDDGAYEKALAASLKTLLCSGGGDTIPILRKLFQRSLSLNLNISVIAATGPESSELVDFVMNKECPVSASLTESDKTNLLQIKRDANK
jgi:pentapeptide repeat protein